MEKRIPHVPLVRVLELVRSGHYEIRLSALQGAAELGWGRDDIVDIVLGLGRSDFYKSMTTYADHRIWQDVYRPKTLAGEIYLKLTVTENVIVVSFKEA
jgi:motility quorum-sensing regulator / GCU-specific mRNA interferase toxin